MEGGSKKRSPTLNHFPQWKLAGGCVALGAHASVSMAAHSYITSSWTCQDVFFQNAPTASHPYTHLGFIVERLTVL